MMDALANFHFLRPLWLILIAPAVALWWLERQEADTTARWRAVMDAELLARLTIGGDSRRRLTPGDLLLAAWVIGACAVAGPTWQRMPQPFAQVARPAVFVLKVTPSMGERDLAPTRLDRAREKMEDLLKLREGAPTGLVAYAGSAHLVVPPTPDPAVVTGMAGALAPDVMPRQGDALADAVKLAAKLIADGGQGGSIVVFADTAPAVTPVDLQGTPVLLFPMLPPARASAAPALRAAATALDADIIAPTIDNADVEGLARVLATAGPPPPAPGEELRWQEAGWWLTPLLAVLVAVWFRRGWVLA
ncbi:VWA domain-containing protein [Chelatococcus asaccharovorans]|uniref:VWA domain-containing protein n=1 Tax=Chelatococcus asaccharovorans TaxID=28210 RepID=UPI00224C70F2|nr:VWA domain-containing protein [Chelatococcus asaccharovorans]CAH1664303.1 Ca-activated chloride channel family protein [Chelatococcus asaccharovorans]CAH1682461.1 Ca-activated chloride channel family protein [Chelatococcus asaccharovorans]